MADLGDVGAAVAEAAMFPQADLLGLPPIPSTRPDVERRARAGRPPGARNKRQEDAARYVIEVFGDPLLRQVAIATMDVDELAARLGCKPIEAVVEQRLAAAAVLPFLHSRKPLAVDVRNHRIVQLTIVDGGAATAEGEAEAEAIEAALVESLEYQRVDGGDDDAL